MPVIDRRSFLVSSGAIVLAAIASIRSGLAAVSGWPVPPQPRREPRIVGNFGHRRPDDYGWLRPKDWHAVLRDPSSLDAEIKQAVLAENAYTRAMMAPSEPLQAEFRSRIADLEPGARARVEIADGDYLYYKRPSADGDHVVHARRLAAGGNEQILLDEGREAQGKTYYFLHWDGPKRASDGQLFGWAADETGSGAFSIRVIDMKTGRIVVDNIANAHGGFTFSPDGRYLYWIGRDEKVRPANVYRRDIASGEDTLIVAESDPASFINLRTTASGRFVVVRIFNGAMTEVHLVSMENPTAKPVLVEPRTPGLTYDVDDWNGRLIVLTDLDGAADFKLMTVPEETPGRLHWKELVPHRPGRFIAAVHPFAGHLVREEWHDANPRLVVMRANGGESEIGFEEPAYTLAVPQGQSWTSDFLVLEFQSPRTPVTIHQLDLVRAALRPGPEPAGPGAFDRRQYEVRRLIARAGDGEEIPLTVLMRRGAALDGRAPLYLYGYGSYGYSVQAEFQPAAIALADHGWIYAIAHVRGGAEKGTRWWRAVLKHGKKLTFTDFIACAEHLIEEGYTSKGRIVAHGLSAGGLLMGAVYNMRPDLWGGVIAQVPFVDVLNTMDDFEDHPLGTSAIPIWGDPRVPEDYAYCASYSPYDQLKPAPYPALLATGGVADDRVAFWEPVKFVAKARALTTAANPIMAKVAMSGGHMGNSGAVAAREQQGLFLAFAVWAAERKWGDVPQRPGDGSG